MRASIPAVFGALLFLGAAACEKDKGTTTGLPTAPSDVITAQVVSIAVTGATSFSQPGGTSQLAVIATLADGTTRDVTAQASCGYSSSWSSTGPYTVVKFSSPCALTAVAYGMQEIDAAYPKATRWPPPPGALLAHVTVRVVPEGTFVLYGSVTQTGYPLAGTNITLTSESSERTIAASPSGDYMFAPVAGDVIVRAQLTGYATQEQRLTIGRDEQLDLELRPATDATDIFGVYRLAFSASPSCSLPPEARQRNYSAKVVEGRSIGRPEDVVVTLAGGEFVGWGNYPGFVGTRNGNTVSFTIGSNLDADYVLIEVIDSKSVLSYDGSASVAIKERSLDGSFNGTLKLFDRFTNAIVGQCQADDHRIVFTR